MARVVPGIQAPDEDPGHGCVRGHGLTSFRHKLFSALIRRSGLAQSMPALAGGKGERRYAPSHWHRAVPSVFDGQPVVAYQPRAQTSDQIIIAFHGGAYVSEAVPTYHGVMAKLVKRTGRRVIKPYYPLAPKHGPDAITDWARRFVEDVVTQHGSDIILMGDSAGAHLALQVALARRDAGQAMPVALILISPWVDFVMDNPALAEQRETVVLDLEALRECARIYAAGADLATLSPLRQDLSGLPPTLVVGGGKDLLWPDIERLAQALKAAFAQDKGGETTLIAEPELHHYWMFFPQPEAKRTWRQIADWID